MARDYEVAIIGGGPNGLTAAAYLARSGTDVVVLEQRFERGGTMASDDYSTPFTYNQAQAALPLGADNPVVAELGLTDRGVAFIEPRVAIEVITSRGEHVIGRGGAGLGSGVQEMLASISRACVPALYRPPDPELSLTSGWRSRGEGAAADLANLTPSTLAALADSEPGRLALRYACAASGFADHGERLGAVDGFTVARWFCPVLVAGGSKSLPNILFRAAASAGATCHVSARVTQVGQADPGFRLSCADGRQVRARNVICTLDPRTTFTGPLRFDTFAPLNHPGGLWDRNRRGYRAQCWRFLCDVFPALRKARLIAQFADAPGDLRRRFATTSTGTVRQGALRPSQTLALRPHPLCADTRTPVPGFYLGGGGVHPGVPGLLAAGMLAAQAVRADHGLDGVAAARR